MKFCIRTWPTSPAWSDSHPFLQLHLAHVPQALCILLILASLGSSCIRCSLSCQNVQTCHSHCLEYYCPPSASSSWSIHIYSDFSSNGPSSAPSDQGGYTNFDSQHICSAHFKFICMIIYSLCRLFAPWWQGAYWFAFTIIFQYSA